MSEQSVAESLAGLREARDALMRPDAPASVNLRDYMPEGSAAWWAFVRAWRVPGYSVRRATMVGWLNAVILNLETQAGGTPGPEPSAPPGTPLHYLTPTGIAEAQAFLARLRERPDADRTPPDDLLFGKHCSRPFDAGVGIVVEPRAFRTRHEAGAYLSPLLAPVRHRVADDAGVWSWLGMFYFPEIVRVKDGRVLLHADTSSLFLGERAAQRRYRHYLWAAWRLYEQHGESVAYMLDQPLTDSGDIARAVFDYPRVFTSAGVIQLILQLYTHGAGTKTGFSVRHQPGGIRHLLRVLPQLELTYDVYGMAPEALLRVLPDDFRHWDARTA